MTALLLAPHGDDETLFAAFTCLHFQPLVVVCFSEGSDREAETAAAMEILECEWEQWPFLEGSRDAAWEWNDFEQRLLSLAGEYPRNRSYDRVFAPTVEENGHETHNAVGQAARAAFGDRVTGYQTYTRTSGRTTSGIPVECEPDWIARKLEALACYRSQIERPATRPWFYDLLDLREWYA